MVLARSKKTGRFLRRKARTNPRKGHRARLKSHRRHVRRRRGRSNPTMLVANPRKRRRRHSALVVVSRSHKPKRARRRRRVMRTNPRRHFARRRHHKKGAVRRRRYRRNPSLGSLKSLLPLVKLGVSGALGIVAARKGGQLYDQYARMMVLGDGTSQARVIANDVGRIVAMAAVPILLRKYVLPHVKVIDGQAFLFGGLAEAGRNAVGVGASRLMPTLNRSAWGLDGLTNVRAFSGLGYANGPRPRLMNGMGGLTNVKAFDGLTNVKAFDGFGRIDQAAGEDANNSDC